MSASSPDDDGDHHDDAERLREWSKRLRLFINSLDDIPASGSALDLCEEALEQWQASAMKNPPPPGTPAILLIVEVGRAIMELCVKSVLDEEITRHDAQASLKESLAAAQQDAQRWLAEGFPSGEEATRRMAAINSSFQMAQEALAAKQAEEECQAGSPYGAILGYQDPSVDSEIVFTRMCEFTEAEHERYTNAYDRLQKMIDRDLLHYVFDQLDVFMAACETTLRDVHEGRFALTNIDKYDEHRQHIRSGLVGVTSAFHMHQTQTYWQCEQKFGKPSKEYSALTKLFHGLYDNCFGYRWLLELRHVMLHINMEALAISLKAQLNRDPELEVNMSRYWMAKSSGVMDKAYKRNELQAMTTDPSVITMTKEAMPALTALQDDIDRVLFPTVAEDTETVRELIGRFEGRKGLYALQSGPGFTASTRIPPYSPLAPRVLAFADSYPH